MADNGGYLQAGLSVADGGEPLTHAQLDFLEAALREVGSLAKVNHDRRSVTWDDDSKTAQQVWQAFRLLDDVEGTTEVACWDCWMAGKWIDQCAHRNDR